jgi:signal transduction histidine kinase
VICLLPLSDVSAAALVSALLESDPRARCGGFESALRDDPALAVWCAIHPRRKSPPQDLRDLAQWLDSNASEVLHWEQGANSPEFEESPSRGRHAARAAQALMLAGTAETLVDAPASGRVRLLAFLSGAYEWLVSCSMPRDPDALEHFAPSWLRRFIGSLREVGASQDRAFEAVKRLSQMPPRGRATLTEFAAAWSREIPLAVETLPRLTSRLARLWGLERSFEAALRREKLASLQKLAYGASHEINNPLANIATRAQALLQAETDPERQRALATINDQAFRAFEMIANMMLFAKPPELTLAPMDVNDLLRRAAEEMNPTAQQQGTALTIRTSEDAGRIHADGTQLAVLLRALLRNALEAVVCGGAVEIAAGRRGEDRVELAVRDTGPGLSDEACRHLFDPFYSSREAGRGLGFGLSWCWTIVELHRGEIAFENTPGMGTTFHITLPVDGRETSRARSGVLLQ